MRERYETEKYFRRMKNATRDIGRRCDTQHKIDIGQTAKREAKSRSSPVVVVLEVVCDSSDPCNLSQVLPRLGMFCFDCPPN